MIAIVSPAKSLDFEKEYDLEATSPRFSKETKTLVKTLREKSANDLQELMSISDKLAELNEERYHNFKFRNPTNSKQAVMAFQGDVYQGLQAEDFSEKDMEFAQDHFRILSGLYGLLRPLDEIQPYRLEMGTKLHFDDYTSLYAFWEDKIAKELKKDLKAQGDDILINLASNEYFKSIDRDILKKSINIVDVEFKDFKNGKYKVISFFAKKARGMMARFIIKNKINDVESLKGFNIDGYAFDPDDSTDSKLAFKRG